MYLAAFIHLVWPLLQMQVISSLLQIHPYPSLPLHSVYSRFSLGVKTDCEATDIICFKAACINCACLVAMVTFSDLIISKSDFMWDGSHTDEMMELEYRWKEAGASRCHLFVLFVLSRADLTQEQFDKKISSFSKWQHEHFVSVVVNHNVSCVHIFWNTFTGAGYVFLCSSVSPDT